jgi:5-methylcytosine-specific restriction endonuclease McrA
MRSEFSAKVKMFAYQRCLVNGKPHCELCDKLILGTPEYDHIKPCGLGGKATKENIMSVCGSCHRRKTHEEDRPIMAKADRSYWAQAGVKAKWKWPKRKFGQ